MELEDYYNAWKEFQIVICALENGVKFENNLEQDNLEKLKSIVHHDLGLVLTELKNLEIAEFNLKKSIEIIEGEIRKEYDGKILKDLNGSLALYLNDLGYLYYIQGDNDKSVEQYMRVITNQNLPNNYPMGYPLLYRGLAHYASEKRDLARSDFLESSKKFRIDAEASPDKSTRKRSLLAYADAISNLARICLDDMDYSGARDKITEAIDLYLASFDLVEGSYSPRESKKAHDNLASIYNLMGKYYYLKNQNEAAKDQFEIARNYAKSELNKARYYNNVGCIYQKENDLDKAKSCYLCAIEKCSSWKIPLENLRRILKFSEEKADLLQYWNKGNRKYLALSLSILLFFAIIAPINWMGLETSEESSDEISIRNGTINSDSFVKMMPNIIKDGSDVWFEKFDPNSLRNTDIKVDAKSTSKRSTSMERRYIIIIFLVLILFFPILKSIKAGPLEIEIQEGKLGTGGASPTFGSAAVGA